MKLKQLATYIPSVLLALIYVGHGIQALFILDEFVNIVLVLGVSETVAQTLVFLVGILDIVVAGLLLFYPRLFVVLWAGIWPVIPNIMKLFGGLAWELGEVIMIGILAILVWYFHVRESRTQKK